MMPHTAPTGPVEERLESVRGRIQRAGGTHVKILAVTKGFGPDAVRAASAVGLTAVGENYGQELVTKAEALSDLDITWHAIGQLQSNKVKLLASHVGVWQSVDRLKVGQRIAQHQPAAQVFVQLRPTDVSEDGPKAGCRLDDAPALIADLQSLGLTVQGVMTVGVNGDREATKRSFVDACALAEEFSLPERSFGMSGDLEDAVELGSTMVRLGTALFGPRPDRLTI